MVDSVGTTGYGYTAFGALQGEDGPWADDAVTYSYTANRMRAGLSLGTPAVQRGHNPTPTMRPIG